LVFQENPELPHDEPAEPEPPGIDIFFSVFADPHAGHGGLLRWLTGTSSSKSLPHAVHLYS
jgi:hypothetical protein